MSQTKIGNLEAIFLIATVMMNHIILNFPKTLHYYNCIRICIYYI